jgi:hypothetical protein
MGVGFGISLVKNRATGQRRWFRYACALRQDRNIFLGWNGTIHEHEFETFEVLTDDDQGLLVERTVACRPLLALRIFRDPINPELGDVQPPEQLELSNRLGGEEVDFSANVSEDRTDGDTSLRSRRTTE